MPWKIPNPVQQVGKPAVKDPVHGETCVALAQILANMPATNTWTRGVQVKGTNLQVGTVIAIFDVHGKFSNESGKAHVALYVGQTDKGIQVVHQNQKKGTITGSFIPFGGGPPTTAHDKSGYDVGKTQSGAALKWPFKPGDNAHHWGVSNTLKKEEDHAEKYYVVEPGP